MRHFVRCRDDTDIFPDMYALSGFRISIIEIILIIVVLIVLPGIACAGYCIYLKKKLDEIDKIENTIKVYEEQASEMADQVLTHESEAVSIRKKISLLYKELTELDLAPDMQNMPIERGPGIARRWQ